MPVRVIGGSSIDLLEAFLHAASENSEVIWCAGPWDPAPLLEIDEELVGTVSPLPLLAAAPEPLRYDTSPLLPAPPLLAQPCPSFVRFTAEAVQLLRVRFPEAAPSTPEALIGILGSTLTGLGYRHVVAPGVALSWDATASVSPPLARGYESALSSDVNVSLETHRLWASTRLSPIRLMIDGACITSDVHTGTQRLVIEVARELSATRPEAVVAVGVNAAHLDVTASAFRGANVAAVDRQDADRFDVVYRPYQMLRAQELRWFENAGRRTLVSQLDMIGFSNPTYHPSSDLFFLARNLQRSMMLNADGVTFISEFGRRSALAEVPDLQRDRTSVVFCGADTEPLNGHRPKSAPDGPYILVLSATFTHKNRSHAIAVFAEAARTHSLEGVLVVAGPEPFYGRSTDVDSAVLDANADVLTGRVAHLGQVTEQEKWWLLRNASAVLYPSTVEGFGLVPFEAASVGVPCLAFRGTALGEILGDGPSTIDSWGIGRWADALTSLLSDPAARQAALDHVGDAAARHTWHATAFATWEAIDRAVAMPRRARVQQEGSFAAAVTRPTGRARLLRARAFYLRLVPYLGRRLSAARSRV